MANIKISALPTAQSVLTTDEFPINQGGTTKKLNYNTIKQSIINNLGITIKTVNLNPNGYIELSNGIILQWGRTANTIGGDNTPYTQNFHKQFVSPPYVVVIGTYTSDGDSPADGGAQRIAQVVSWTKDNFVWYSDTFQVQPNTIGIHWFSIGM
jgi:hypothetical protein